MSNGNALETTGQTDKSISEIDAAVNAQAARRAKKSGGATPGPEGATPTTVPAGEKPKRKIYTPEERIQRAKDLEAERTNRQNTRRQESAANKKAAEEKRGTPHMSKVAKAAQGLAPMDAETEAVFNEAKGSLSNTQLAILVAHLGFHSRSEATKGSLEVKLAEGMPVTIVSGAPKYIGRTGTVAKAQRIHCFITVDALEGAPQPNKDLYLFNYDVRPIEVPSAPAGAPEGEAPASGDEIAA